MWDEKPLSQFHEYQYDFLRKFNVGSIDQYTLHASQTVKEQKTNNVFLIIIYVFTLTTEGYIWSKMYVHFYIHMAEIKKIKTFLTGIINISLLMYRQYLSRWFVKIPK